MALPIIHRRADALNAFQAKQLVAEHDYLQLEQERIEKQQEFAIARSRLDDEIEAELREAEQQRTAVAAEFRRSTLSDMQAASRELTAVEKEHIKARERNQRQKVYAPVPGVVQQLAVHTLGGVVTPAQELMLIVAQGDNLEVEAWLPNKDIGFVHEGQAAEVKVETFPPYQVRDHRRGDTGCIRRRRGG